jgi:hypothetical protein
VIDIFVDYSTIWIPRQVVITMRAVCDAAAEDRVLAEVLGVGVGRVPVAGEYGELDDVALGDCAGAADVPVADLDLSWRGRCPPVRPGQIQ